MKNKQKLPVVYYQIKKIRDFWVKSSSINKMEMIKLFDESLEEIKLQVELAEIKNWDEVS